MTDYDDLPSAIPSADERLAAIRERKAERQAVRTAFAARRARGLPFRMAQRLRNLAASRERAESNTERRTDVPVKRVSDAERAECRQLAAQARRALPPRLRDRQPSPRAVRPAQAQIRVPAGVAEVLRRFQQDGQPLSITDPPMID
jgi:hypothetical protein